jgi:hypothetical protein
VLPEEIEHAVAQTSVPVRFPGRIRLPVSALVIESVCIGNPWLQLDDGRCFRATDLGWLATLLQPLLKRHSGLRQVFGYPSGQLVYYVFSFRTSPERTSFYTRFDRLIFQYLHYVLLP